MRRAPTYSEIGARIQGFRERTGLSQRELARRLGVRKDTVAAIEAGRKSLNAEETQRIAGCLGIPARKLLVEVEVEGLMDSFRKQGEDPEFLRSVQVIEDLARDLIRADPVAQRIGEARTKADHSFSRPPDRGRRQAKPGFKAMRLYEVVASLVQDEALTYREVAARINEHCLYVPGDGSFVAVENVRDAVRHHPGLFHVDRTLAPHRISVPRTGT